MHAHSSAPSGGVAWVAEIPDPDGGLLVRKPCSTIVGVEGSSPAV